MAPTSPNPSVPARSAAGASRRLLPRSVYPLRVLGMGLGGLLVGSVLYERQAPTLYWMLCVASIWLWPHIAYLAATRSVDPFRAEVRNLLIDSAIVGMLVPLMQFNLLPIDPAL